MCLLLISGCATTVREHTVTRHHWDGVVLQTPQFPIQAYYTVNYQPELPLTVMIEGDGYAWVTRTMPSADPTPTKTTALDIAFTQPNAAYLGRPCQYHRTAACNPFYWTIGRFHPDVMSAMDDALTQLKNRFQAKTLRLMGYSGGGVVAGYLAATRNDVSEWVTVASPIDLDAWVAHHNITPLKDSISLAPYQSRLMQIKQRHYLGAKDTIVPPETHYAWQKAAASYAHIQWIVLPASRHSGPWPLGNK